MSTESRLQDALNSGQEVTVTFTNNKPHLAEGEGMQTLRGRLVATNTPDVVQFQPTLGAPVPVPVTRILLIED